MTSFKGVLRAKVWVLASPEATCCRWPSLLANAVARAIRFSVR